MRIVVNHLTRMGAPRICVAGIDPEEGRHVRPIVAAGGKPFTRELLAEEGGPFALGMMLDLVDAVPAPRPPRTEDCVVSTERMKVVGRVSEARCVQLLRQRAADSLASLFSPAIARQGWNFAVEDGLGAVTCLRYSSQPMNRAGSMERFFYRL